MPDQHELTQWVSCVDRQPPVGVPVVVWYRGRLAVGERVDRDDIPGGKPWIIDRMSGGPTWGTNRPDLWLDGLSHPS